MRKLLKFTSVWAFMAFNVSASKHFNADEATQLYIKKYTALSTFESMRSGIPTSVILAQGILESRSGQSELTQKTNNHFCIKWRNNMKNFECANFKDDTYDKKGRKIAEPFVKYPTVEESYKHHSEFLRANPLYRNLFTFHRDDYKNWSIGLEKCGYATEKNYGQMLVRIIEQNKLFLLDMPDALQPDQEFNFTPTITAASVEDKPEQPNLVANNNAMSEGFYEYISSSSETLDVSTKSIPIGKNNLKKEKLVKKATPTPAVEGFYEFSTGQQ